MCGIVGYVGEEQAAPILLDGLAKLEYRGYDSAGVAVYDGEKINVVKAKGRLQALRDLTQDGAGLQGYVGIGHTRWATHGEPSVSNAHPHYNQSHSITVVHNGIIENYQPLREKLISKGFEFHSDTDTEVIAHLLDYYYTGDPKTAIIKVLHRVIGSYALGILFQDHPGKVYAVRKDSPLIIGVSEHGNYIASDVPAILKYTRDVYYIDNFELAELSMHEVHFYNQDCEEIVKEQVTVAWDVEAAEKGGYEHFMLKEIYEQPKAVASTISPRIKEDKIVIEELNMSREEIRQIRRIYIIGCGSAYHVGMIGKYVLEQMTRIPVEVDLASEFRYRNPILEPDSMVIIISQSGETADSLAALRKAQELGSKVLGIVNVVGSSIAREADNVMYTWAGPEISVATTKAYSTQLTALYMLGMLFGEAKGILAEAEYADMIKELRLLPEKIQQLLGDKERIQWFASKYANAAHVFFIGRGVDYASSMEGSLKLKEISYIHSEAYAAGELKHGTISLIEDDILTVSVSTQPELYEKMISNTVEVKTRGAYVFALVSEDNQGMKDIADFAVEIPHTHPCFTPSLSVIPLQLFGYYVSVAKGLDVDKPRNLAKSVTVE
ncbi:MAG: glutamine--fructose-6-phosphate transaminase (isomerizing) [Bacteroides sp.]|nr:glutamine--fructose-6-phosphate transaminase (isomerizing) [Bacteroides sp.]MCM1548483.1 glutamine--fructose-6-phosphate transaminase (isomerizing) [Clostridium sp.]